MANWVFSTGRTLGILTCSALLLISATLGQPGHAPPVRSVPAVIERVSSTGGFDAPETRPGTPESAAVEEPSPAADSASGATSAAAIPPPRSLPDGRIVPGSSSGVPDDNLRFSIASPVRMAPVRIQIPDAWVDAPIQPVGVTAGGRMETPDSYWEVGWYRHGARPGDDGRAVIAGHLDSPEGAAVFYFIQDLEPGDEIRVLLGGPDGERIFTVRETAQYPADDVPVEHIFGPSDHPELVLITCDGTWNGSDAGYSDRFVVYADMVAPEEHASQDASSS